MKKLYISYMKQFHIKQKNGIIHKEEYFFDPIWNSSTEEGGKDKNEKGNSIWNGNDNSIIPVGGMWFTKWGHFGK